AQAAPIATQRAAATESVLAALTAGEGALRGLGRIGVARTDTHHAPAAPAWTETSLTQVPGALTPTLPGRAPLELPPRHRVALGGDRVLPEHARQMHDVVGHPARGLLRVGMLPTLRLDEGGTWTRCPSQ